MPLGAPEGPDSAVAAAFAHPDVARLRATLRARPGVEAAVAPEDPPPRRAAVALVIRVEAPAEGGDGAPDLLFVRRAEYDGDPWSGHVAFPGGRHEPGDATLWDTAARETWEETGLDLRRGAAVLGTLDEIYPRTPLLPAIVVRPYVVVAAPRAPMALSAELAAAFWVPLRRFAEAGAETTSVVRARGEERRVPSFVHDAHTIWGMTHRILRQLLERLGA